MKAIFTLFLVLFIGVAAQAQSTTTQTKDVKVETIEMTVVTFTSLEEAAREKILKLRVCTNSRIKKALKFTTKKNKAKMA